MDVKLHLQVLILGILRASLNINFNTNGNAENCREDGDDSTLLEPTSGEQSSKLLSWWTVGKRSYLFLRSSFKNAEVSPISKALQLFPKTENNFKKTILECFLETALNSAAVMIIETSINGILEPN